jgi:hypothetical protein
MKKVILILSAVATMISCSGQSKTANNNALIIEEDGNMKTKEIIWTTMNVWKKADPKQGKMGSYEVEQLAFLGYDFVKTCSIEIKTIIAFYSKMSIHEDIQSFAEALGGFSSLEEAQQVLLENKEHYFKDIQIQGHYFKFLEIEIDESIVSVTLGANRTDKFKIHENGDIEYLP